jgi:hypothetical protein
MENDMKRILVVVPFLLLILCSFAVRAEAQCGIPSPSPLPCTIVGTVSGLSAGATVTLADNGIPVLTTPNGPFGFSTIFANYSISVNSPSGQKCMVANKQGTVTGFVVSNVAVTCTTPPDVVSCVPNGCVSEAEICANIANSLEYPPVNPGALLQWPVVGYVCIVGGLPPVYAGVARTASDPPATPMSPDEMTNIASVSKILTAVAILQLLTANGVAINTPIANYIYKDWVLGPNITQITFEELLNHTSGLGQLSACDDALTYFDVQALVAAGNPVPTNLGQPKYGNCNFTLLRELTPALLAQSPNCPTITTCVPAGAARAEMSMQLYINYVNTNVLQPAGVPVSGCTPPVGSADMLSYPLPAGTVPGTDWGDWSMTCGAGGWNMSANELFSVIDALANGSALLNIFQKIEMFKNNLGWDSAVRPDCPSQPFAPDAANVCKNGGLSQSFVNNVLHPPVNALWTYAGILGCYVPVVVVVNSPTPPPFTASNNAPPGFELPDIIDLVAQAYSGAAIPGMSGPCPGILGVFPLTTK